MTQFEFQVQVFLGGDANRDGKVDGVDRLTVLANLNQGGSWSEGDFNGDSVVDNAGPAFRIYRHTGHHVVSYTGIGALPFWSLWSAVTRGEDAPLLGWLEWSSE